MGARKNDMQMSKQMKSQTFWQNFVESLGLPSPPFDCDLKTRFDVLVNKITGFSEL